MPELLSAERRLVMRVLESWERLRGARPFPQASDVAASDFGADWANCFLIAIGPATGQWAFRHVGDELLVPGWDKGMGRALADCPDNTVLRHASAYMLKVLDKRVPISMGGTFDTGDARILFRSVMLPLSDDGAKVDSVLGAANCRQVAAAGDLADAAQVRPV